MKKIKLFKTLLIPSSGVLTLGTIVAVVTSCSCSLQPTPVIHVESVSLDEHNLGLAVGDNRYLNATISPADATDKSVTWTSSNETVAKVDEYGQVTAVREGTTTITVTTNDGHYIDTCEVTVNEWIVPVVVTANADSTLELTNHDSNPDLHYSTDDGTSWNTYSGEISISQGQTLLLKGNNPEGWSTRTTTYSNFNITGDVSLSGNIMALIDNGKGTATAAIPNEYCFYSLFRNSTGITSVSKDFLSATTLADRCYESMFQNCTSLTVAPDLPATTLTDRCYFGMFYGCTNLRNAPELPATKLAKFCYAFMFNGCTSLTQAPDLPATSLAEGCYNAMFVYCSSLTVAPDLPATTLQNHCYEYMFNSCSSLNSIRIGYTGTVAEAPLFAFSDWVTGVASSGTFYYNGDQTAQDFGFPVRWTVIPN